MGTIVERPRKNKSTAYMAKIVLKREGKIVHRETQTFERRAAAAAWIARREHELAKPGAIDRANKPTSTLADAIDKYTTTNTGMGRTKTQVLTALRNMPIAQMACERIKSPDILALIDTLSIDRQPQTVGNYISHLQSVFTVAADAWDYPLDREQIAKAIRAARRLGTVTKSKSRSRRPTLDELDRLMEYFQAAYANRPASIPMHQVTAFALFSTRRLEEITRITWADYEGDRIMVRNMKHPGQKIGNDVWCDLPAPAPAIIEAMPKTAAEIFPYEHKTISARFTRACQFLAIADLHFHDLRHEGISRVSEMGMTLQQAAAVSGHRGYQSLQRYTHLRQTGDKYAGWGWIERVS